MYSAQDLTVMTLSLMPFVVEIGIFGSLDFFFPFPSLSLSLAKAKRNVVISVDVALPVEREGRDEEETSVDGRVVRRQGCEATSLRFTRYGSGKCRER